MTGTERALLFLGALALALAFFTTGIQEGFALGWFVCTAAFLMLVEDEQGPPWV